jgi:hypothetical protein
MSDVNLIEALEAVGLNPIVIDENTTFLQESPFIEGTDIQWAWDATSLNNAKRCAQLYKYVNIDGYRAKEESVNLRFGAEVHKAFHQYEIVRATGMDHEEAVWHVVRELVHRTVDFNPDHKYKNREFLVRCVVGYLDKFQNDSATTVMLHDEMTGKDKPAVELPFNFALDWGPNDDTNYILCGYLDRVVELGGTRYVMDYKTTTMTPGDYYFKQFEPDNQMSLYTLAAGVIFDKPAQGVIIHAIQITIEKGDRFVPGVTYRSPEVLQEWIDDLHQHLDTFLKYAEEGRWPKNDTACDKYGGCAFRDVCNASPSVRQEFLDAKFVKAERWNPLKPR